MHTNKNTEMTEEQWIWQRGREAHLSVVATLCTGGAAQSAGNTYRRTLFSSDVLISLAIESFNHSSFKTYKTLYTIYFKGLNESADMGIEH